MARKFKVEDLEKIFTNPFYAVTVAPIFCEPHEPMVSKEEFIKVGVKMIKDEGAEKYLRLLLENLEGNYLAAADLED